MAIEQVNERPIFPALSDPKTPTVGIWSVNMIRQLTTVFQQYGYRLNHAILDEDLTDNGGTVLTTSDLVQNSGTVPEINQAQTWTVSQIFNAATTFNAAVTITVQSSGSDLLVLDTERAWAISQEGAGAAAELALYPKVDDKNFTIFSNNKTNVVARFHASNTAANCFFRVQNGAAVIGSPTGLTAGAGILNAEGLRVNNSPVLEDADLQANGGNIPETNRANNFSVMQQVAGVDIVSDGSNANGEWVRFSNGIQICTDVIASVDSTEAVGNIFRSSASERVSFTWAQSFDALYWADAAVNSTFRWGTNVTATTTGGDVGVMAATSSTGASVRVFAIGTWS